MKVITQEDEEHLRKGLRKMYEHDNSVGLEVAQLYEGEKGSQ